MKKKLISLLLAVVMVLGMVPVFELPASAAGETWADGTTWEAAHPGQTHPYGCADCTWNATYTQWMCTSGSAAVSAGKNAGLVDGKHTCLVNYDGLATVTSGSVVIQGTTGGCATWADRTYTRIETRITGDSLTSRTKVPFPTGFVATYTVQVFLTRVETTAE